MAVKKLEARIQHKRDTSANWTSNDPVLLAGEIIIVDTASGEVRTKVGDGQSRYTKLPFDDEPLRSLIGERVAANQGVANAGKVLGIGADGLVTAVESGAGAKTWGDLAGVNE